MHMFTFGSGTIAYVIVRLFTIVHAALLWVLPDGDLRIHLFMVNTGCTPARSRSINNTTLTGVPASRSCQVPTRCAQTLKEE